jgi:hypothetical protein
MVSYRTVVQQLLERRERRELRELRELRAPSSKANRLAPPLEQQMQIKRPVM